VDNNEIRGVQAAENKLSSQDQLTPSPVPQTRETVNNAPAPYKKTETNTKDSKFINLLPQIIPAAVKQSAIKPSLNMNGKLYFRTFMWMGSYGSSLELTWLFLVGIMVSSLKILRTVV
jgi:hypothetical protein